MSNPCENKFESIHYNLCDEEIVLPTAELMIVNLLFEYIVDKRTVQCVCPQYISVLIQINADKKFVSASPYLHTLDCLETIIIT